MRTIAANGLVLEPQTAAHAGEMFAVLSDPAIYEFENAPPASVEWLRARFARLESRRSADGAEQWLNWVVSQAGQLIGYVQATVYADGYAAIAYEFASAHWGLGLARQAVQAMIAELGEEYGVTTLTAVLKRANWRSQRLLDRLGFALASPSLHRKYNVDPDEILMQRSQGMSYKGSCHCGRVAFEVEGTITGAASCNCSICHRKGVVMWFVPRSDLRLLTADDQASTYTFNKHVIKHRFCPVCGIHTHGEGVDPKGNAMAAINLRCLEGVDLDQVPVQQFDGRSL